jgi:TetR/AcrR family transcriptional repressor of nem operon
MARERRGRPNNGTATEVLDVAERLVQERGFNGFSYADISAEMGITTASLHYHFAGKAELGRALIDRYSLRFGEALDAIEASPTTAPAKLAAYAELYANVLRQQRLCLCGVLAAEYQTLPEPMRGSVLRFFEGNEAWLKRILELGASEGSLHLSGSLEDVARMIVSGLEGAMLIARPFSDVARFDSAAAQLLGSLAAGPANR